MPEVRRNAVVDIGFRGDEAAGIGVRAVGVEDLAHGALGALVRMTSPPGLRVARPRARTVVNSRISASSSCHRCPVGSRRGLTFSSVGAASPVKHRTPGGPGGGLRVRAFPKWLTQRLEKGDHGGPALVDSDGSSSE